MKSKIQATLAQNILQTVPRLLTQLDRDPLSPTYGCFDRNFWHYKIRDFPSFVLQQNVLSLTLLYKNKFEGNIYYQNPNILSYIKAGLDFWCQYQHKSGGFDEYWPNEDGYPPLVFSFYAVARTYRELELNDQKVLKSLDRAFDRWTEYVETDANNQEMAGVAAAYQYYLITKSSQAEAHFKTRLSKILKKQTKEGWFPEYGGADIGYSSVFLHYLSDVSDNYTSKQVKKALTKLVDFLSEFVHPDGTTGGEYGSRNTEYFLFKGLVTALQHTPKAAKIIKGLDWGLDNLDDRYLFHYIFLSYIEGFLRLKQTKSVSFNGTKQKSIKKFYPESGMVVLGNSENYFVTNLKKGGVYKLFAKDKLISQGAGYRIKHQNKYLVSAWINPETEINVSNDFSEIKLISKFYLNKFFVSAPLKHIGLRILSYLPLSNLIQMLKKVLIFQDEQSIFSFERKFVFHKKKLIIKDQIDQKLKGNRIFKLGIGAIRFVPSSNFFNKSSLSIELFEKIKPNNKMQISQELELKT
ncbi:MAG: hypothetical protein GF381_02080 [Candidatus Pacebacteria bacterium]|nr:hypothetical protein [Candidatus Paceibacterota bacterium]